MTVGVEVGQEALAALESDGSEVDESLPVGAEEGGCLDGGDSLVPTEDVLAQPLRDRKTVPIASRPLASFLIANIVCPFNLSAAGKQVSESTLHRSHPSLKQESDQPAAILRRVAGARDAHV